MEVPQTVRRWHYNTTQNRYNLRLACRITKAQIRTHPVIVIDTYCFSTATMVTRTLRDVTLYIHCLSWLNILFPQYENAHSLSVILQSVVICSLGTQLAHGLGFSTTYVLYSSHLYPYTRGPKLLQKILKLFLIPRP